MQEIVDRHFEELRRELVLRNCFVTPQIELIDDLLDFLMGVLI